MQARGFLPRLNDAGKESVGPDGWIDGSWPRVLAGLLFRLKSLPPLRSTTSCSSEIRVEMLKKIFGQLTTTEHITLYQKDMSVSHTTLPLAKMNVWSKRSGASALSATQTSGCWADRLLRRIQWFELNNSVVAATKQPHLPLTMVKARGRD